jgi:hypothetical protein
MAGRDMGHSHCSSVMARLGPAMTDGIVVPASLNQRL